MRKARLFVVPLAVVLLTAGCAVTVGGTAQRAPGFPPRPLPGQTIQQVLLGDTTLTRIVKQPLTVDLRFPPRSGGPEALRADGPAAPVDCLGVAGMLERIAYRSSNVRGVAVETWRHAARSTALTDVKEGVVSLPAATDAGALFAQFSQRWQACDGKTQSLSDSMLRLKARISHVQVADSVLGATVWVGFASSQADSDFIPAARAIGVRGSCLVEVEVDFFNATQTSLQRPSEINTTAVDIARTMMDRVGALN